MSNTRLKIALKKLATSYNDDATKQLEGLMNADQVNLVTDLSTVAKANDVLKLHMQLIKNGGHSKKHGIMKTKFQGRNGKM